MKVTSETSVAEAVQNAADNIKRLGNAITPNICGGRDAAGGHVESLTEAVMGVTAGLHAIASAISDLAEAVRKR